MNRPILHTALLCICLSGSVARSEQKLYVSPKDPKTSKDSDDDICTLDNTSAAMRTAQLVKDGATQKLVLRWQGLDLRGEPDAVDVTATVALGLGAAPSEWTIQIENSVYLDQIGAAAPALCFDPTNGHPLGGSRHWVDSYRDMG